MKVLELFGGIGAPRAALKNLGIESTFKLVEFDKKVVNVYNHIWDENEKPIDIRGFKTTEYYDLVVAGFPCQPFSMTGKSQGVHDEKGRGNLYLETLRVIKETKPKYIILENVKGILQKKHKWVIDEIIKMLQKLGYHVRWDLLNSHNFGSIQKRERVYIYGSLITPPVNANNYEIKLDKTLKDYLEDKVDEKLYYGKETLDKILAHKPLGKIDELMENRTRIPSLFYKSFNAENYITGEYSKDFGTITAQGANSRQRVLLKKGLKTRSITERESWRLMGFSDNLFNKVAHLPKSHLFYTAGNSMEIGTIEAVMKALLNNEK